MQSKNHRQSSREWVRRKNGSTSESLAKSTTWMARAWEARIAGIIGAEDVNAECMGKPYDLVFNGKTINLKVANIYKRKTKHGRAVGFCDGWWRFNNAKGKCDFFLCIGLEKENIRKVLLIPSDVYPKSGITVGRGESKYNKYSICLTSFTL